MTLVSVCCSDFIRGNGAPLDPLDLLPALSLSSCPMAFPCIAVIDETLQIHMKDILESLGATLLC